MADIDDTEDESTDDSSAGSSVTPALPTTGRSPLNPTVASYIARLAQNKQELANAQAQANRNLLVSQIGRIGSTIAQSGYGNPNKIDTSAFDSFDKSAQKPVEDILAQQKNEESTTKTMGEEAKTAATISANDPNSDLSKATQDYMRTNFPGKMSEVELSHLTAAMVPTIAKLVETQEKYKQASYDRGAKSKERDDEKAKDANQKMRKDLMTFRGNTNVQLAATAVRNADNALDLVTRVPTSQNLSLLADEMGKVAMNGVPSEQGVKALMPDTLGTKAAQLKAWATGHPNASAADVSEYLQNDKDYLEAIKKIAKTAVNDYQMNTLKGWKGKVKPDDYQDAVNDLGLGGYQMSTRNPGGQNNSPMSGTVLMKDPQGNLRQVPASKKQAALDAGGTLVQ